jgi:nicotinamide mononucleotide transporter
MTTIEIIATVFGLACVLLYIRQSIWSWPTGLVQVVLYAWVFYHARLYSDFLLHIVYTALQIYGWYHWLRGGKQDGQLPVRRISLRAAGLCGVIALLGTGSVGYLMRRFTNADLPYWDATIMVLSLLAQYLIARKVLENWIIWVGVDILATGVYWYKGLYVTTGLYSVFLFMAITGWIAWLKSYRTSSSAAAAVSCSANSSPLTVGTSS